MTKNKPTVALVGAGASGIAAAVTVAKTLKETGRTARVLLLDSNDVFAKKLYATGNGRCNYSNEDISDKYYHGSKVLLNTVCEKIPPSEVRSFFSDLGLSSFADAAGRLYPRSRTASAVVDLLYENCVSLGIEIRLSYKVETLERQGSAWLINQELHADKLILAAGGAASPAHGTRGDVFRLLKALGITYRPLCPALTSMTVSGFPKSLKGVRANGSIALVCEGETLEADEGELQYTEYGLSGIPAMNVSGTAARALFQKREVQAIVDCLPGLDFPEWKNEFSSVRANTPALSLGAYLSGIVPQRLAHVLLSEAGLKAEDPISSLQTKGVGALWKELKEKRYRISGVKGFDFAQVTSGGVDETEVDPATLEAKKCKGLYLCGETLDVDGVCGGYNLHWAWASGILAGKSCVLELFG